MIKELFTNATILITAISLGNIYVKKITFKPRKLSRRLLLGLIAGTLGCVLMLFSIPVGPSLIVDLRTVPILIVAFYATLPSLAVATALGFIFRIFIFGVSQTSIVGGLSILVIAVACALIARIRINRKLKWIFGIACVCIVAAISLLILRIPTYDFWLILSGYSGGHIVTGLAAYFYLKHITKLNAAYDKLHADSKTDFLTGLVNFRHFDKSLNACFKTAVMTDQVLSILFLDIDNFKCINDTYGHLAGDHILKTLSGQLLKTCRNTDIVCRRGGEEFTIILPKCNLEQACSMAERIRKKVANCVHTLTSGETVGITVSIGVSCYPETSTREEALIDQADTALYQAKHSGKNTVMSA